MLKAKKLKGKNFGISPDFQKKFQSVERRRCIVLRRQKKRVRPSTLVGRSLMSCLLTVFKYKNVKCKTSGQTISLPNLRKFSSKNWGFCLHCYYVL